MSPGPTSFSLQQPLLEVRGEDGTRGNWTIGDAVEGVQIFGGIGSGKTSGSGRTIALKFLQAGFGGLVLTAKPDEKADWVEYCRLTDRSQDLVVLEPGGPHRFNFLHYESTQTGSGAQAPTANIVQVLKTVIRAGDEKRGGGQDNVFWETALDMLLVNVVELCQLAYGRVTLKELYDIAQAIPQQPEVNGAVVTNDNDTAFGHAYLAAKAKVDAQVETWKATLTDEQRELFAVDHVQYEAALSDAIADARTLMQLYRFFIGTMEKLSERTRSTINMMLSGLLFHLLREPVYSLLCHGTSTVTPEDSLQGKVLLLNLPVKVYQKVGQDCQVLFKYIWQRAMEKRNVKENGRPVFLWADEAQNFLHEHDAVYQATARSSRIATVYISQNLPNYHACMGGEKALFRVKSFLGTLNTKFFHTNADIETNAYASGLIGQDYADKLTESLQLGPDYGGSVTRTSELASHVRPEHFARLKTGGERNGGAVECYMVWQGDSFLADRNHVKVTFKQHLAPSAS